MDFGKLPVLSPTIKGVSVILMIMGHVKSLVYSVECHSKTS